MDRSNHYEAAFEAYLRAGGLCYVAIDESKRATLDDEPVKSLDFIVYGPGDARLLVDVKGRRFPSGKPKHRPKYTWQNWVMAEDVDGLVRWEQRFGPGYRGLLVFAYHILPAVELPLMTPDLWRWRGKAYLFRAVPVEDYRREMRVRSPRWATVHLPGAAFREMVRPFQAFVGAGALGAAGR